MTSAPSFDDIFGAMSAAALGDLTARVAVPDDPQLDDVPTRLALGVNVLLDDLSSRVNAADRMREGYRSMFESSPLPMYVLDLSTLRFVEANDAAVRHYGYTREEFLEMNAADLWPSEDAAKNLEVATHPLPLRGVLMRHRRKDGSLRWVDVHVNALTFDGRPCRIVLVNDVTQRVADEDARRAAESRFARLRDSGIIGIIVTNLAGPVVEVNDALVDLLGYAREELVSGRVRWSDLTPHEWRSTDQRAMEQLTSAGVASLREKEYVRHDGLRIPVLVGSAMLEGTGGDCISFVLDLRSSKEAAAAVEHLREALASEATFRGFVEAVPDAVIILNRDDRIVLVNSQTEKLFGYRRDELVGQSTEMIMPERFRKQYGSRFEDQLAGLRGVGPHSREGYGRRRDGTEFPFESTLGLLESAGETLLCSSVRDTTERKRAEGARARAKDAAEAASLELEAFSYSVAHDLRAPLRGMNGFAQVLLDTYRDKLDADGQEFLQEILLNTSKMADLIDGLLSLARVTRSDLQREHADLSEIVREVAAGLRAVEPHRKVEVTAPDSLAADVDPRLARALFENLLGNAWKFTRKQPAARIEFGATEGDGGLVFFVRDNGAGFDMAYANKLFAPFQRLHTDEAFAGAGIGLATAQRIVHRHGGRIWAEGMVGLGASFYFTIPARVMEATSSDGSA